MSPNFTYRNFKLPELPETLSERQPWGRAGDEPSLCDLLTDPLLHTVMRRDGVTIAQLKTVIAVARRKLGAAPSPCLAA